MINTLRNVFEQEISTKKKTLLFLSFLRVFFTFRIVCCYKRSKANQMYRNDEAISKKLEFLFFQIGLLVNTTLTFIIHSDYLYEFILFSTFNMAACRICKPYKVSSDRLRIHPTGFQTNSIRLYHRSFIVINWQ